MTYLLKSRSPPKCLILNTHTSTGQLLFYNTILSIKRNGYQAFGQHRFEYIVLRQQNFRQNFTQKFPENFGTKVCNFVTKLSRESFVKKYDQGRVKFWRNFVKTLYVIRIT